MLFFEVTGDAKLRVLMLTARREAVAIIYETGACAASIRPEGYVAKFGMPRFSLLKRSEAVDRSGR